MNLQASSGPETVPPGTPRFPTAKQRVAVLVLLAGMLLLGASSDELHGWLIELLAVAQTLVQQRPVLGVVAFIVYAALSAMLAFVSSAVIVPVGIYVWGKAASLLLLWMGWTLGGVVAYSLARYLGRPAANALAPAELLARYENRLTHRATFGLVLLFQLAMPSEVPGYLLGLVRYSFWKYLAALALAEVPYAVATIYLGAGFIERQRWTLLGVGVAVAVFSGWALYTLHRRISNRHADSRNHS